jgi:hypothetical protein
MTDFQVQLADTYAGHPAFAFHAKPLEVDPVALAAFSETFEAVRSNTAQLSFRYVRAAAHQCRDVMDSIFGAMSGQTTDDYERRFLTELQSECASRMFSEFAFYAFRRAGDSAERTSNSMLDALRSRRHFIGAISWRFTEALRTTTAGAASRLRALADDGQFGRAELSVNAGAEIDAACEILNAEFTQTGVLAAASAYCRTPLTVTELALELSVAHATWWRGKLQGTVRAPQTMYAHLDESTSQLKAIVYLSDVDPENGPTSCYPGVYDALRLHPLQELVGRVIANVGSHTDSPLRRYYGRARIRSMSLASFRAGTRVDRARRHFMRLPPELRFNSHLGWDVLPDSALEASLVDMERVILGRPGTFILFDGAHLLHRGGMVQQRPRLVLQAVLSDPRSDRPHRPGASRDDTSVASAATSGSPSRRSVA